MTTRRQYSDHHTNNIKELLDTPHVWFTPDSLNYDSGFGSTNKPYLVWRFGSIYYALSHDPQKDMRLVVYGPGICSLGSEPWGWNYDPWYELEGQRPKSRHSVVLPVFQSNHSQKERKLITMITSDYSEYFYDITNKLAKYGITENLKALATIDPDNFADPHHKVILYLTDQEAQNI
jgi:hypothetical protein